MDAPAVALRATLALLARVRPGCRPGPAPLPARVPGAVLDRADWAAPPLGVRQSGAPVRGVCAADAPPWGEVARTRGPVAPTPAAAPVGPRANLTFFSLNVRSFRCRGRAGLIRRALVRAGEPDVVMLQELKVWRADRRDLNLRGYRLVTFAARTCETGHRAGGAAIFLRCRCRFWLLMLFLTRRRPCGVPRGHGGRAGYSRVGACGRRGIRQHVNACAVP